MAKKSLAEPLRDYQIDLIGQIETAIANGHRRIMLQLPTGAGKTRCFVELVKNHRFAPYAGGVPNCLIIAHREELIKQADEELKQELKNSPHICIGIIKAGRELSPRCSIQVASIQTFNSRLNTKQWLPPAGLVIIDEAHHATAETYQRVIEHYGEAIILGVTATPIRADGKGFNDTFDILIKGPSIKELTAQQHLCPFRLFAYYIQRINLRNVSTRAGDFDIHQLADAVATSEVRADLVKTWEQYAKGKRTVVFAVNKKLSKEYTKAYCDAGYRAEHVDGDTPEDERTAILTRFKEGKTQILCNCNIVTEGFNLPEMECVQVVRPTKSLSFWLQMVGRSLRISNDKTEAIILDHTDNYERLGLPDAERNWTLDGIDRNSQKSVKPKRSIEEKERTLDHLEGELVEIYSNLENTKIAMDKEAQQDLTSLNKFLLANSEELEAKQLESNEKRNRKAKEKSEAARQTTTLEVKNNTESIERTSYLVNELIDRTLREGLRTKLYKFPLKRGEEKIKDNYTQFLFVGNSEKVDGAGEFLITGDIYFKKGSQYILYWKIANGELVYQQREELSPFYRLEFKKRVKSQEAVLEVERKARIRRQKQFEEREKKNKIAQAIFEQLKSQK